MIPGRLRWVLALVFTGAGYGCSMFREEIPQLLYRFNLAATVDNSACDDLARAMQDAPASLKVRRTPGPPAPHVSCNAVLDETNGNHHEVDLHLRGATLDLVIVRHSAFGANTPNEASMHLADQLIAIVKLHYPKSNAQRVTVYSSPLGP